MNVQRLKPTDNELRNQRVIQGHSAGYGAILLLLRRLHLFLGRRFLAHDRRSGRLFSRLDLSGPVRDRSDDHRQIIGTYSTFAKYFLPIWPTRSPIFTFVFGTAIFSDTAHAEYSWRDMSSRDSG